MRGTMMPDGDNTNSGRRHFGFADVQVKWDMVYRDRREWESGRAAPRFARAWNVMCMRIGMMVFFVWMVTLLRGDCKMVEQKSRR
jgi:hypothetical protein